MALWDHDWGLYNAMTYGMTAFGPVLLSWQIFKLHSFETTNMRIWVSDVGFSRDCLRYEMVLTG